MIQTQRIINLAQSNESIQNLIFHNKISDNLVKKFEANNLSSSISLKEQ